MIFSLKTNNTHRNFLTKIYKSIKSKEFDYNDSYYKELLDNLNIKKINDNKNNSFINSYLSKILDVIKKIYKNFKLNDDSITYLTHFETTKENYNENFIIKKHFKFILFSIIVKNGDKYYSYVYKNETWHKIDLSNSANIITTDITLEKIMNDENGKQKTYIYINEDFLRSIFDNYDPYDKNIYTQSRDKLYESYSSGFSLIIPPIPTTP